MNFTVDGEGSKETEIVFVGGKTGIRTVDADDVEVVLVVAEHGVESSVGEFAVVEFQSNTRIHKVFVVAAAASESNGFGAGVGRISAEVGVSCGGDATSTFDLFSFTFSFLLFKSHQMFETTFFRTR